MIHLMGEEGIHGRSKSMSAVRFLMNEEVSNPHRDAVG